eukprot:1169724-Prymnesium_polylepis.2
MSMVWFHALRFYKYAMRVDEDVCINRLPRYELMTALKADYAFGLETIETHQETRDTLLPWLADYIALKRLQPAITPLPTDKIYFTNFFITRVEWWLQGEVNTFLHDVTASGGIYLHRWGDAPIQTAALRLQGSVEAVKHMDIDYLHLSTHNRIAGGREVAFNAHGVQNAHFRRLAEQAISNATNLTNLTNLTDGANASTRQQPGEECKHPNSGHDFAEESGTSSTEAFFTASSQAELHDAINTITTRGPSRVCPTSHERYIKESWHPLLREVSEKEFVPNFQTRKWMICGPSDAECQGHLKINATSSALGYPFVSDGQAAVVVGTYSLSADQRPPGYGNEAHMDEPLNFRRSAISTIFVTQSLKITREIRIPNSQSVIRVIGAPHTTLEAVGVHRIFSLAPHAEVELANLTFVAGTAPGCASRSFLNGIPFETSSVSAGLPSWWSPSTYIGTGTPSRSGGAIYVGIFAKLRIVGCTFSNNAACAEGGAVFGEPFTKIEFRSSTLANNSAWGHGGGAHVSAYGFLRFVDGSRGIGNIAGFNGGALDSWGHSSIFVDEAFFEGNVCGELGGAVHGFTPLVHIVVKRSTIQHNRAGVHGGGLYVCGGGTLETVDSRLLYNIAMFSGGGSFQWDAAVVNVRGSGTLIAHNTAGDCGGALACPTGLSTKLLVTDGATLLNNSADKGGAICFAGTADLYGAIIQYNQALTNGGAVYLLGALHIRGRSNISSNEAGGRGGAIFLRRSLARPTSEQNMAVQHFVTHSELLFNRARAGNGGAIFCEDGMDLTVDSVMMNHNTAPQASGGAIFASKHSKVKVCGSSHLDWNSALEAGALAIVDQSSLIVVDSTRLNHNSALGRGGAVSATGGSTIIVYDAAQLNHNEAQVGGAISCCSRSQVFVGGGQCRFIFGFIDWAASGDSVEDNKVLITPATGSAEAGGMGSIDSGGQIMEVIPSPGQRTPFAFCLPTGMWHIWMLSRYGRGWGENYLSVTLPDGPKLELRLTTSSDAPPVKQVTARQVNHSQATTSGGRQAAAAGGVAFRKAVNFTVTSNLQNSANGRILISYNRAASQGGALFLQGESFAFVLRSTLLANSAGGGDGGAIGVSELCTIALLKSELFNNDASRGGALHAAVLASISLSTVIAANNSATLSGGAFYFRSLRSAVLNAVVAQGNKAISAGGASMITDTHVDTRRCNFTGNAAHKGGAVCAEDSKLQLVANTFTENWANGGDGGALFLSGRYDESVLADPLECLDIDVFIDWRATTDDCNSHELHFPESTWHVPWCDQFAASYASCDAAAASLHYTSSIASMGMVGYDLCAGCSCNADRDISTSFVRLSSRDSDRTPVKVEAWTGAMHHMRVCDFRPGEHVLVEAIDARGMSWYGGSVSIISQGQLLVDRLQVNGSSSSVSIRVPSTEVSSTNRFVNNSASNGGGGAVFWADSELADCMNHSTGWAANTAAYGANCASPVQSFQMVSSQCSIIASGEWSPILAASVEDALSIHLIDHYGQMATSHPGLNIMAHPLDDAVVLQSNSAQFTRGVAKFSQLAAFMGPGNEVAIRLSVPQLSNMVQVACSTICPPHLVASIGGLGRTQCTCPLGSHLTASKMCEVCPLGTSSDPATSATGSCDVCDIGFYYYQPLSVCRRCPEGGLCPWNTTLDSVVVAAGFWRFSTDATTIYQCSGVGITYCKGGTDAGIEGSGYCQEGYAGPLCKLCTEPKMHYSDSRCVDCPAIGGRVMIVVGSIVGAILLLPPTAFAVARNAPKTYRWIVCWVNHLRMWLQDVAMMPKIKIAIGFFQTTTFTPDVYGLALPGWYYDWVRFLNVFQSAPRREFKPPSSQQFADNARSFRPQLIGQDSLYLVNV